jgi:hypothetical protein
MHFYYSSGFVRVRLDMIIFLTFFKQYETEDPNFIHDIFMAYFEQNPYSPMALLFHLKLPICRKNSNKALTPLNYIKDLNPKRVQRTSSNLDVDYECVILNFLLIDGELIDLILSL